MTLIDSTLCLMTAALASSDPPCLAGTLGSHLLFWLLGTIGVVCVVAVVGRLVQRSRRILKSGFWRSGHFWKYGPMGRVLRGLDPEESPDSLTLGKNRYF